MMGFLFIIFIISAAAIDREPLAGLVCIEALAALWLLNEQGWRVAMGYKTCPYCGAHLDPGEICDCQDDVATSQQEQSKGDKDSEKKEEKYDE